MIKQLVILLTVSFIFPIHDGIAQKTDTIVHVNGNVLTGDFKKMVYGVVTWKMDGMGTLSLDEVKVNKIKSRKQFEVKTKDGTVYFGTFDTSDVAKKLVIQTKDGDKTVDIREIVEIYPIRGNFWRRMSGNFSLGLNYSKGSHLATLSLAGNLDYRKKKAYFGLSWDFYNTYQGDSLGSSKWDVSLAWQRYIAYKWSTQLAFGMSQNSELGSKLRMIFSVIGLRDLLYNNWTRFYAGAGLAVTRETPYDTTATTTDLTGLFQVVWKVYKLTKPKVWVDASISFLPFMTGDSRYMVTASMVPKISLFNDNFKVGLNFYYAFDSRPPLGAVSTDDYGINLELTFSLH